LALAALASEQHAEACCGEGRRARIYGYAQQGDGNEAVADGASAHDYTLDVKQDETKGMEQQTPTEQGAYIFHG